MADQNGHDSETSRRDLLKGIAALPTFAAGAGRSSAEPSQAAGAQRSNANQPEREASSKKKFVALQIGARSFVDEGVDKCLDTIQEKAGVNVLMSTVLTYGTGLAGRQARPTPLPDHGGQEYDQVHGGSYTKVHPEFYANSVIGDVRAPELGDFDILADVTPKAKARGMQTYALFEEAYNPRLMPNFEKIAEVDVYGRTGRSTCFNNPYARAFLVSLVGDWFRHNDLDGMMWESERQGPLNTTIEAHFGQIGRRGSINCFCSHCERKGHENGIDVGRAKQGYVALDQWVAEGLNQPRSGTGSFVSFWRLLTEYPEIVAWHKQWFRSQEEVYGLLYGTVKEANPRAQVGWHIMHLVTISPFYQADQSYARLAKFSDYLKPCPYNNCAGPRLAQYIRNVQSTIYHDSTPEEVLELHYKMLGLHGEPTLAKLPSTGLSSEYVRRETERAIAEVKGAIPIYPGIDIDIPTAMTEKRTQPADVKAAVLAAFKGGAPGIVLSRKYAEMRLANLAGCGEALKEIGAL